MQDNIKKSDSLWACGAFKAPSVLIGKGEMKLTQEYDELSDLLMEQIRKNSNELFIHMNCVDKAKEIAQNAIQAGDNGRFENKGKGFFEWIISN